MTVKSGSIPSRRARSWEPRVDLRSGERYLAVTLRGAALKENAVLNKGTCFTPEERDELGLRGVLPPAVASQTEQEMRAYDNYLEAGDDVGRYLCRTGAASGTCCAMPSATTAR